MQFPAFAPFVCISAAYAIISLPNLSAFNFFYILFVSPFCSEFTPSLTQPTNPSHAICILADLLTQPRTWLFWWNFPEVMLNWCSILCVVVPLAHCWNPSKLLNQLDLEIKFRQSTAEIIDGNGKHALGFGGITH